MTHEPIDDIDIYIEYTSRRGTRRLRRIRPKEIVYGNSQWHEDEQEQYMLRAYDFDKQDMRDFLMKNIHGWYPRLEDYK